MGFFLAITALPKDEARHPKPSVDGKGLLPQLAILTSEREKGMTEALGETFYGPELRMAV